MKYLGIAAGCIATAILFALVPSYEEVKYNFRGSDIYLLDRNGELLNQTRVDHSVRALEWTPLGEISEHLIATTIAAEDKRFFSHHGVDYFALLNAARGWVSGKALRGASTITMQVASLLSNEVGGKRRGIGAKISQIATALVLDLFWTKQEILETYLNLAPFRGELRGVSAAASATFRKHPLYLSLDESAILAALIRAPNAAPPVVAQRACGIRKIQDCTALSEHTQRTLTLPSSLAPPQTAPHAARVLISDKTRSPAESRLILSTIDRSLQEFALESLKAHLAPLRDQNVQDGAILIARNSTGEIVTYVGNSGADSSARHVDGVRAPRQAGSTLKPFIYAEAIERRILTPNSLLDDSPLEISVGGGLYRPKNYDKSFQGPVTVRESLAASLNVPAVRALSLAGLEQSRMRLISFGFENLRAASYYGHALALGSPSVTLWQLVGAYRTLADGGTYRPLTLTQRQASSVRHSLSPQTAFIISSILSDRGSRGRTFGLENPLSTPFWSAVKTGTSRDMTDNWCIGYTKDFTVGVWIGNFSGSPMHNVTGVTGAAPLWSTLIHHLHQRNDEPSSEPPLPPGIVSRARGGELEWYLSGTEPPELFRPSTQPNSSRRPTIEYPLHGLTIAFDPDIPPAAQQLLIRATTKDPAFEWDIDGIVTVASHFYWPIVPGKHTAVLRAQGKELDRVEYVVK